MLNTAEDYLSEKEGKPRIIHYNGSFAYFEEIKELNINKIKNGNGAPIPNDFFTDSEHAKCSQIVLLTTDGINYFYFGPLFKSYFSYSYDNVNYVNSKIYYFSGNDLDLLFSGLQVIQSSNLHFLEIAKLYNNLFDLELSRIVLSDLISVSLPVISNRERFFLLSQEVKQIIISHKLSEKLVRNVTSIRSSEPQLYLLKRAIREKLSANKLEIAIRKLSRTINILSDNEQIKAIDIVLADFQIYDRVIVADFFSHLDKLIQTLKKKHITVIVQKNETLTDNIIRIQIPKKV